MPLSDVEIWAEIGAGYLIIDPLPTHDRVGASSIDFLLHSEIIALPNPEAATGIAVDPSLVDVMSILERYGQKKDLSVGPYEIKPREFVIGYTHEKLQLPSHLAARIEGKSSLGRLGLAVHVTAPTVHAGFRGRLTLEMINAGPFALKLTHKMEISQLIVERLNIPSKSLYSGRYQDQG
jgi:dCTP deaminase